MRSSLAFAFALALASSLAASPTDRVEAFRSLHGLASEDSALVQKIREELALARVMPPEESLGYLRQVLPEVLTAYPQAAPGLRTAVQLAQEVPYALEHAFRARAVAFTFLGPIERGGKGLKGSAEVAFPILARSCIRAGGLPGQNHSERAAVTRRGLATLALAEASFPHALAGATLRSLLRAAADSSVPDAAVRLWSARGLSPWILAKSPSPKVRFLEGGELYGHTALPAELSLTYLSHFASTLVVRSDFTRDERGHMAMALRLIRGQTPEKAKQILADTFTKLRKAAQGSN